jgi:hypothetical protein
MSKWLYTLECPDGRLFAKIVNATLEGDAEVLGNDLWREAGLDPLTDDTVNVSLRKLANA